MLCITRFLPAVTILAMPVLSQQQFAELGKRHLPASTDGTHAVAKGDVDGDGDLDLVFGNAVGANGMGGQNRLYLNNGTGTFTDATTGRMPTDNDDTYAVAMGDVDGDGDLDVIFGHVLSRSCSRHRLYLNDGTGVFADATTPRMPATCLATTAIAIGDVDGDGDLDLVFGNVYSHRISQTQLYLNDGTGTFTDATAARMPVDNDDTYGVALGDVDGDGDLDVVCGNGSAAFASTGQQNRLYLNDGTGQFTDATARLPWDRNVTLGVAMGDLDGDGDLELIFANAGSGYWKQNRLCINDGTGTFKDLTVGRMPLVDFDYTHAVAIGDVDGDGDFDLVFGNSESTLQNRLFVNDGTATFTDGTAARMPHDADHTSAVALGDMDGDGDLDVLFGSAFGPNSYKSIPQSRLYLNDGAGTFESATTSHTPTAGDYTLGVALGDVDGDGDPDLVIGNTGEESDPLNRQNRLYLNGGDGTFTDATAARMPTDSDYTAAVAIGDVDGDHDNDVVFANWFQNRLYVNDGTGKFTDATGTRLPTDGFGAVDVALGDVDLDRDLDLVFASGGQNRLYVNDGKGNFTNAGTGRLPTANDDVSSVAMGDVDGDGDRDLVFGNWSLLTRLYLNDGTGTFTDASARLPTPYSDSTLDVAMGDVDGDADLDLVFANSRARDRLFLNDGTGTFTDAGATRIPDNRNTQAVATGDVDGDGDLDLVFGSLLHPNRLYLNDGQGQFTDATPTRLPIESDYSFAVVLGDVDRDGDLDVVFGNWGPNRVYVNLLRQLDSPFLVIPGREFHLDAYARYSSPGLIDVAFPFVSMATARLPLPPFGTIGLDPSSMIALPAIVIPQPAGVGSTTAMVPQNPALLGRSLHAQALLLQWPGPAFLTDMTSDRIVR